MKKFLIDISTEKLKDNDYKVSKVAQLIKPETFGLDDTYFGGNVAHVVKLKNKDYYLLVNRLHKTIGICVKTDELDKLTKVDLLAWAKVQNVTLEKNATKEDIIDKLKG